MAVLVCISLLASKVTYLFTPLSAFGVSSSVN